MAGRTFSHLCHPREGDRTCREGLAPGLGQQHVAEAEAEPGPLETHHRAKPRASRALPFAFSWYRSLDLPSCFWPLAVVLHTVPVTMLKEILCLYGLYQPKKSCTYTSLLLALPCLKNSLRGHSYLSFLASNMIKV